jgi:hypothetical protein
MASIERPETCDEVLREVREIKEALAQAHGYDVRRILDDAREKQKRSGRTVLPPPRRDDA